MHQRIRHTASFLVIILIGTLICASAFATAPGPTVTSVSGEVLVKFQASASADDVANVELSADVDHGERISNVKSGAIWRLHSRSLSTDVLTIALQENPNVVYAEPNYIVHATDTPNDPSYSQLWGLKNTGQTIGGSPGTAGSDISAEAAWTVTKGSAAIVVGVVDTGVDYTHADLAANIWSNPGGKGSVACAAGTHGFNAITKTCDPRDDHFHGTHVSGTIGAVGNNNLGVVGVNWTASIMALKFLDATGSGSTADAITAIDFAVQAKIDGVNVRILSNSWGGGAFSKALLDEINKANENDILFVAAAGNDSSNNDTSPHYPANYSTANMIAVAATDNRDALAYFSDYGATSVHLGAPGVNVLSCYPGGSYQTLSGTSMATPHVAGVAALVLAKTPSLTTAQVKSAILDNTDPIPSLTGKTVTGGRLNAARAVGAPQGPGFTLTASPSSRSIAPGAATSYTVTVTPNNGFAGSVDLSVTGLPTGTSGTFNPTTTAATSTLTVTTTNAVPLTSYTLTITGVSGAITHSTSATLTVVANPPSTACPSFSPSFSYFAAYSPTSVAVGDFNRDGKADIAVASTSSNTVAVLLGTGNGSFQFPVNYNVGTAPLSVAVGDLNGDGKADLVVANSISNSVSVLIGNGDGTFQSAVNYTAGTNPFWVAIGDFNGDGKRDLVVANNGSSNVSILAGNGDGTFQAAVNYGAGSGPFWVSVGDFNGDGRADLAVADYNGGKVSVLLGNGDGSFQTAVAYGVGNGPSSVAIADFNGDGKADLAVSNYVSNNVSILAGIGDGTFQAAVNYPAGSGPYSVAVFDVNGDGRPDLAVADSLSNYVSILAGRGDGTFLAAINYPTDSGPDQVSVGDFNGDGKADLVVANGNSNDVSILLNSGVCSLNCDTLAAAANYTAGTTPDALAIGDFNGDGQPDLAVVNNGSNNISIELGSSNGTFQPVHVYGVGSAPVSVYTGDFNGDGKLDLAVANSASNDVSILLGNGDGSFQSALSYSAGTTPHSVTAGDFNRDGRPDLAVANNGSNDVSILLGSGNGAFLPAVNYTAGTNPESVAVADFNRDGKVDLAVANSGSNNVSILAGNGDGTFQPATSVGAGSGPMFVVTHDFDHDGKADLAVANNGSNNVSILLGNGNGSFHSAVNYGTGTSPIGLALGDFDDDGRLDLAVANNGSNNISILLGNGDGTFAGAGNSAAGTGPHFIAARDFNRDGKSDLVVANSGSGNFSILLNTCPVPDLTVTLTHTGTFSQGDTGKVYTITVNNAGIAPTSGVVTAVDSLPAGLTAAAMSGTGWMCNLPTATCTRGDVLAAGNSYQPITVTVNVANSASPTVTNMASVSGGGEVNTVNDSVSDPTTVTPVTDVIVSSTHAGSFTQGDTGRVYRITARNAGGSPTSGTVTVTDSLPAGLTATAISGTGWTCNFGMLSCTRSDVLPGSTSYPAVTVTVNVAANAPNLVTNMATVSGGGETNTANDTANDPTVIWVSHTCASFSSPVTYLAGFAPRGLATGDFNGDRKTDLVVINSSSSNVSILLGNGSGTFAPAVNYAVGNNPIAIAVADLNNDGNADLVVANYYSSTVSVLLGRGDGTFATAVNYSVGSSPLSVTVGDFNGDGNLDVAVANFNSNNVSILLGNGDGTLHTAVTYVVGNSPGYVVSADFNGDGITDLAVVSYYNFSLSILLGNGDGTFQTPVSYTISSYYNDGLAVGDFNGDGKLDLAVASYYSGYVSILLGNGNGTFQPAVTYSTGFYGSASIAVEDVNGDGHADLITANSGANVVTILLGNGDGTFGTAINYAAGGGPQQVVVGDFNGDGKPDLAVADYYDGRVGVMLGGCPDLTIAKTHSGNFIGGQTNVPYALTVTNSGGGATQGTVTVTDALPSGLTASSLSGVGWTCDMPNLRCTRSDSLTGGGSYPIITLNVNVSKTAPSMVTNTATVSGGGDTNLTNNSASDPTTINQVADLTITKTHSGSFAQGQTGRTYTIIVGNGGSAPTSGTVTVVDNVPSGLTPTAMAGAGWNCNLPSRTCARNDALAVNTSYPAITLTVNVDSNAPTSLTNNASVSGGGEVDPSNDSAADLTTVLSTPANLVATAISTSQVSLTWDPVVNATSYQVLRSSNNGPFTQVGAPLTNGFTDPSLTPATTYLYRIRAADTSVAGLPGSIDLATTILFTDDPISIGQTMAKAVHITELRTAVNAVRAAAGLPPATFSDSPLAAGLRVRAVHLTELRSNLDPARAAIGVPALVYTDPTLPAGAIIKAAHVRDLRAGVK